MESNEKPRRRPRIGASTRSNDSTNYQSNPHSEQSEGYQHRPYSPRPTGGNYRPQGNRFSQSGEERQERNYTPNYRPQRYNSSNGESGDQRPYTPRQHGPRPQGASYGNRPRYNNDRPNQHQDGEARFNRYNDGESSQNRPQGQYGRPRPQGRYNNRPNSGSGRPFQRPQRANQDGMPLGGKSFVPKPKPVEYEQPIMSPDDELRLNKYMANAGICSRREADELIPQGLITVNGKPVTELGAKIKYGDIVEYNGKVVTLEKKCYVLLNKPKDCMTTCDDPKDRKTVMDLVKGACNERIYPVGRLDRMTTGVLLLTNDGELASKLTHPQYVKKKIYHVWTDKDIAEEDMQAIADGIELEDGEIHADAISYATDTDRNQAGIEIHSGKNRIIRRIFEHLGYHVTKLDRVYFAGLTKKNLPRGRWRYLTQAEVNSLLTGRFE